MKRVALVCPGRGTYTRSELGIFSSSGLVGGAPAAPDYIQRADRWRASIGRTPVSELDSKERFSSVHLQGENAAALIFTAGAVDARSVSEDLEVVCVCGNSMGWYTALHVAGVLGFDDGLRLADTMGGLQAEEGVVGGRRVVGHHGRPGERGGGGHQQQQRNSKKLGTFLSTTSKCQSWQKKNKQNHI